MPWHVARSDSCPASHPWAVIKDADGSVEGCHANRRMAEEQMRALYANEPGDRTWYRITNTADAAEIFLYDEVGQWGVTANDFVKELRDVKASAIDVHINSPGGECYDGLAIFNALRSHRANVTVYIDGLAASAASFIAMAGDRIVAERNASLMIHNAHAVGVGDADDMRRLGDMLDKMTGTIANIYAERAGGTVEDWRARMKTETWFSADEAKTAGLVDEVTTAPPPRGMPRNTWDLSIFNFAGRDKAPDPFARQKPPESQPTKDPPDEAGFLMPALDLGRIRESVQSLDDIPISPDLFKAAVALAINDVPAPDPAPAPAPDSEPDLFINLPDLRRALREARL